MEDQIKFCLIAACFCLSLTYGNHVVDKRNAMLLRMALLFTVFADFCLLIAHENTAGILLFCVVQLLYVLRYGHARGLWRLLLLPVVVFVMLIFVFKIELLVACGALYALCFCFSLFRAFRQYRGRRFPFTNRLLSLVGMLLFAACDINVALYNSNFAFVKAHARDFLALIWLFYLPSQVCLAFSAKKFSAKGEHIGACSAAI